MHLLTLLLLMMLLLPTRICHIRFLIEYETFMLCTWLLQTCLPLTLLLIPAHMYSSAALATAFHGLYKLLYFATRLFNNCGTRFHISSETEPVSMMLPILVGVMVYFVAPSHMTLLVSSSYAVMTLHIEYR